VHPAQRLRASRQLVAQLAARLASGTGRRLDMFLSRVALARAGLQSLDPTAVLARGYSITYDARGGVVRDAARVNDAEVISTTLARGAIESVVKKPS